MTKNEIKIFKICSAFRKAIEIRKDQLGVVFKNFPAGSCGDTTLLLGTFLKHIGYGDFYYKFKEISENGDSKSHAWLENAEGLVIDITADQFTDGPGKVVVEVNSKWHQSWNGEIAYIADFNIFDDNTKTYLNNLYIQIINEYNNIIYNNKNKYKELI